MSSNAASGKQSRYRVDCYVCGPEAASPTRSIEHDQAHGFTAHILELRCPNCGRLLRRIEDRNYYMETAPDVDLGLRY